MELKKAHASISSPDNTVKDTKKIEIDELKHGIEKVDEIVGKIASIEKSALYMATQSHSMSGISVVINDGLLECQSNIAELNELIASELNEYTTIEWIAPIDCAVK